MRSVTLDSTASPGDFPREYAVYFSTDGKNWGDAVLKGKGIGPITEILFGPRRTRFIKIEQTGQSDGSFWSIHELRVEVV